MKKYDILKDALLGMYVKDLTSVAVHTASHVRTLVQQGAMLHGPWNCKDQA